MLSFSDENRILIDKSKDNKSAALLLSDGKIYHAATSRLYYSVFQKSLSYQKHYFNYDDNDRSSSSHAQLINSVDQEIKKLMSDSSLRREAMRCIDFKPRMNELKGLRVESDYKSIKEDFTEEEYNNNYKIYGNISDILTKYSSVLEKR